MDSHGAGKETPKLSGMWVNHEGKLCEMFRMGDAVVNRLFNCVKDNWDGSIRFSFNPEYISRTGW